MGILSVAFLVATLYSVGLAAKCNSHSFDYDTVENICIEMDDALSYNSSAGYYRPQPEDIKMMLNESTGILEVHFPLASSNKYYSYELTLYVNESYGETCEDSSNEAIHSSYEFDVFNCSEIKNKEDCSPTCNKMGVVEFKYVFRGCYRLGIVPKKEGRGPNFYSNRYLFKSDYKKQYVWDIVPIMHNHCNYDTREVRVIVRVLGLLTEAPAIVTLMRDINVTIGGYCTKTGHEHAHCVSTPVPDNSLSCEAKSTSGSPRDCTIHGETLDCTFGDIKPGNYCVTFELCDRVRCKKGSRVWTVNKGVPKNCIFTHMFNCPEKEIDAHITTLEVPISAKSTAIIAVGVIVLCVLFAAMGYVISRKYIWPKQSHIAMGLVSSPVDNARPCILLLYAQDCDEFMQLMSTLRSLLANMGQCEVLDCFDPNRFNDIARNPMQWINRYTSLPDVKVVVVASECAAAHQKAALKGTSIQYKVPTSTCNLFLYGLDEITNNRRREYTNTFVVRFDDIDLDFINPYTRYTLPTHLRILLERINPSLNLAAGQYIDEEKLNRDHSTYMDFRRKNPMYLSTLMTRSA